MWLKKIKRKKLQFIIVAFILLMSTAILTACISFALGVQEFVDDYYAYDQCPTLFTILTKDNGVEILQNTPELMNLVDELETREAKMVSSDFYCNNKKLKNGAVTVYGIDDRFRLRFPIEIIDGEKTASPKDGEIWINNICANINNLDVGDVIQVDNERKDEYKISAIITTPECSSGLLDSYPYYVNSSTLENVDGTTVYPIQIYAKDASVTDKDIGENFPKEFVSEVIMELGSGLKMCLTILSTIFGGIGVVAAIVIFSVSSIIIRYMVKSTLAKEYHMIGIYKALGRSNREIKLIYFKSYLFASLIGILFGVFVGMPLTMYLASIILGGIKGFQLSTTTYVVCAVCVLATLALLSLNIWAQLRKIHKITPIQAMQYGMSSSKEKLCKSFIPNAHSPFSIATNNLVKNKGMSLLIILILSVSFYLCILLSAASLTMGNYENNQEIWNNLPKYDGYIRYEKGKDYLSYLESSPFVEDYVRMGFDETASSLKFIDCDLGGEESHPQIYSNFTLERYQDVPFRSGRICVNPHEIAASKDFMKRVEKKVGEYLTISCNGVEIDFLIVGEYSAMTKGGVSFYMQESDWLELGNKFLGDNYLFFLKDNVTYEQFKQDFESKFSGVKVYNEFDFIANEAVTVTSMSNPICFVLFIAFTAFSLLNVINLLYNTSRENRRKYGILKAMGFTSRYIISVNLLQLILQSITAIVISCIVHEIVSPKLFSIAAGVDYIYKPIWLTATVCIGIFTVIMLIGIIMSLPIRKIAPVELMEE